MKRLFAVIGLGRFGYSVAETLVKKGCEVLAIDRDDERIQAISDIATFAVQCDATDERALKAVSAQNVDVAVVSIGENIEASILIVQTLKEIGYEGYLTVQLDANARAIDPDAWMVDSFNYMKDVMQECGVWED